MIEKEDTKILLANLTEDEFELLERIFEQILEQGEESIAEMETLKPPMDCDCGGKCLHSMLGGAIRAAIDQDIKRKKRTHEMLKIIRQKFGLK